MRQKTLFSFASQCFALVWLLFTCSCYTTRAVPSPGTAPLSYDARDKDALFVSVDGKRVRVDPNTQLRFLRIDGSYTPWVRAALLAVSEEGVFVRDGVNDMDGGPDGLRWSDIHLAEVKNLSGPKTLGGIAITTAAVVVIVAALTGGDIPTPKWGSANVSGCCNTTVVVHAPAPSSPPPTYYEESVLSKPGFTPPSDALAHSLFSPEARRRAAMKVVVSLDTGVASQKAVRSSSLLGFNQLSTGAALSFRFLDMLEVGGGFRQILSGASPVRALSTPTSPLVGFVRAGFHLNMDPLHLVSVPLGADLGGADGTTYLKINAGLRFRLKDGLSLGVYPVNPSFLDTPDDALPEGRWTFPTSLELSWAF